MRPKLPELEPYDPFNQNHYEKILSHFNVKVWAAYEKHFGRSYWGYSWKCGGVQLCPESNLTEDMARAVSALAIYLYCCGVDCGLDDRLALCYIKQRPFIVEKKNGA